MTRRMLSVRRLVPIGALALVAGAAVAQASGGSAPSRPAPAAALPAAAPTVVVAARGGRRSAPPAARVLPVPACKPSAGSIAKAPPSEALREAFGILRRDRTDEDALPASALAALKRSRLTPVDPESTRLLRADATARAWIVPVPNVDAASPFACVEAAGRAAREGVAVVSIGGAPAGGGGALRDLKRGVAPAAVDACAGVAHDMLGVSGIVPDGVDAVFVTEPDGTATRADVHDNGYSFVLPRTKRPESRYLVWTGSDGTPHVQPLQVAIVRPASFACRTSYKGTRVTPNPLDDCVLHSSSPLYNTLARIVTLSRARGSRGGKPARRAARPLIVYAPCAPSTFGAFIPIWPRTGAIVVAQAPPCVTAPTKPKPRTP